MGNTFNAFIAFISEDPIMLGLCIAIVVLIVMFILVLVIGKKKDSYKEEDTKKINNDELLKTEINMEALRSTNEYKIEELNPGLPSLEPKTEPVKENVQVEEIPVTTEEPIKVEIKDKAETSNIELVPETSDVLEPINEENVIDIDANKEEPTFSSIDDLKISPEESTIETPNIDVSDALENLTVVESNELPIEDIPAETISAEEIKIEPTIIEENKKDVIESATIPLEQEEIPTEPTIPNADDVFGVKAPEPIETTEPLTETLKDNIFNQENNQPEIDIPVTPIEPENPVEIESLELAPEENVFNTKPEPAEITPTEPVADSIELPTMTEEDNIELPDYSDIYSIDDIELPSINLDELTNNSFSPFDKPKETVEPVDEEADLDLPKLNSTTSSTINSLQGESFKID